MNSKASLSFSRSSSTRTVPPFFSLPNRISSASGFLMMFLDHARQRTRAEGVVIALLAQPARGFRRQIEGHVAVGQLRFQFQHEFLDHPVDGVAAERREGDRRVQPVAEFRREQLLDRFFVLAFALAAAEADGFLGGVGRARIGRHDQHDIAEIDLLAVVIGQLAVIHHLQQDVEQVRMRLFDFVEQQHAMRMLVDAVGEQPALVEADIARRRADQPRRPCGAPYIRSCRSAGAPRP